MHLFSKDRSNYSLWCIDLLITQGYVDKNILILTDKFLRFSPVNMEVKGHCEWQPSCASYHVLHSAQILGTLGVAVVFCQVCCCEAVLVLDAQVHPIDHKDLTALESDT